MHTQKRGKPVISSCVACQPNHSMILWSTWYLYSMYKYTYRYVSWSPLSSLCHMNILLCISTWYLSTGYNVLVPGTCSSLLEYTTDHSTFNWLSRSSRPCVIPTWFKISSHVDHSSAKAILKHNYVDTVLNIRNDVKPRPCRLENTAHYQKSVHPIKCRMCSA